MAFAIWAGGTTARSAPPDAGFTNALTIEEPNSTAARCQPLRAPTRPATSAVAHRAVPVVAASTSSRRRSTRSATTPAGKVATSAPTWPIPLIRPACATDPVSSNASSGTANVPTPAPIAFANRPVVRSM